MFPRILARSACLVATSSVFSLGSRFRASLEVRSSEPLFQRFAVLSSVTIKTVRAHTGGRAAHTFTALISCSIFVD